MKRNSRVHSRWVWLVSVAVVAMVASSLPAAAYPPPPCEPPNELVQVGTEIVDGEVEIIWECRQTGDDGGGGGGDEPTCDVEMITRAMDNDAVFDDVRDTYGSPYCVNELSCATKVPSSIPEDMWPEDKPREDAIWSFTVCTADGVEWDGTWDWYVPPEPPLLDQAWRAYNNLRADQFSLAFGPDDRGYVGTTTYFWVDITAPGELSSQAFNVVATATPRSITVDPGNGDETITCGWPTSQTEDCIKKYFETSIGGTAVADGRPAFNASATLHYDITFTYNGGPLPADVLAQLPETLEGGPESAPIPIGEVQVIVE